MLRQVTTSVQFAAISETTRPRRGLKSRGFSNVHPATKQLDGRKQTQALPSSLTVVPVFRASGHTIKTSAMPSSSTLHYAAKQLDDTVTNKRSQPHDRQLHISQEAIKPQVAPFNGSWDSWMHPGDHQACSAAFKALQNTTQLHGIHASRKRDKSVLRTKG